MFNKDGLYMALAERRDTKDYVSNFNYDEWSLLSHFEVATNDLASCHGRQMDGSCVCGTPSFTIMSSCTVLTVNVSVHIHLLLTVDHTSIILHVCNVYVTSSLMMLLSLHSQDQINMSPSVTDFCKKIALECSSQQIAMDLFVCTSQHVDLATICKSSIYSSYTPLLPGQA